MLVEPRLVPCTNGLVILPEELYETLRTGALNGVVYFREDEDVVTISVTKLRGARRRLLNHGYRIQMLREASRVAIIEFPEGVQLMAAEWRGPRRLPDESSD